MTDTVERPPGREAETITRVVVRFAGDSGDGMQLTGDRFTSVSATFGNDLSTLPEYPAEIRAPAGTVNGVSSFQVQISDHDITTPGDEPSVLVAMNPAALKADLGRLDSGLGQRTPSCRDGRVVGRLVGGPVASLHHARDAFQKAAGELETSERGREAILDVLRRRHPTGQGTRNRQQ